MKCVEDEWNQFAMTRLDADLFLLRFNFWSSTMQCCYRDGSGW